MPIDRHAHSYMYVSTLLCVHSQSTGSYAVGHGLIDRAQLTSLFTCQTPRSRPISLFHSKPFNYARDAAFLTSRLDLESAQTGSASASGSTAASACWPQVPDWSEFTFFAPYARTPPAQVTAHTNTVAMIGSRTYVCLRHTHTALQPGGSAFTRPKFRYCTAILTQTGV
jgi:hypothetical protein